MKRFILTFALAFLFIPYTFAAEDLSMFETVYSPVMPELVKPTVVSVNLPTDNKYENAVIEKETGKPQALLKISHYEETILEATESSSIIGKLSALTDQDFDTTAEFNLDKDGGSAYVILKTDDTVTSKSLSLSLANNVALPHTIGLSAYIDGNWKTVVAAKKMESSYLNFPETSASEWRIEFGHGQPLVLREITLNKSSASEKTGIEIRWLARNGESYKLYSDARSYPNIRTPEAGKLQGEDLEVIEIDLGEPETNPFFKEPDYDEDGIIDLMDNCVKISNTDQEDIDDNGRGDVCEDFDGDGVVNSVDNCPDHPNRSQMDVDDDGIGDECDGEESRITEKNPWLPWTAMGIAALVIFIVIAQTVKKK